MPPRAGGPLRNRRVRTRLVALILIPTIAAVLLGGLRIASSIDRAADYGRAQQLAELGEKVTALTQGLANERGAVTSYIASGRGQNLDEVEKQQRAVDQQIASVEAQLKPIDASYGSLVQSKADTVQLRLEQLPYLRELVVNSKLPPLATVDKYASIVADLTALTEVIAEGSSDRQLAERVRMLVVLARATEQAVQQRDVLLTALLAKDLSQNELDRLVAARAQQDSAIVSFKALAPVADRQHYEDTVTGVQIDDAERLLLTVISRGDGADLGITPEEWSKVATIKIDRLNDVESRLVHDLVAQSSDLGSAARWDVLADSLIVVVVLALALAATSIVARSMVQPLHALRSGALDVAGRRLPDAVRRLRESPEIRPAIEPIGVESSDEIGEVARSFDVVHREAVRLAVEEAQLRGTVSAMFVNLSRRSQTLVERQLSLIDGLEQGEQDPDRLSSLFRLDHLATRMRRNGENLLVLAGQEPARRWSQPVPLVDVVRASLSEVEQYERVRLQVQPGAVGGWAVNDLVHLVAELLDNATSYSAPDTAVTVNGELFSDGTGLLDIEDSGIGMPPADLMLANERLAQPPVVDVSVSRRMGLFVVGRLAARHGIRVQLRLSRNGGVVAQVLLPASILVPAPAAQPAPVETPPAPVEFPPAPREFPQTPMEFPPAPMESSPYPQPWPATPDQPAPVEPPTAPQGWPAAAVPVELPPHLAGDLSVGPPTSPNHVTVGPASIPPRTPFEAGSEPGPAPHEPAWDDPAEAVPAASGPPTPARPSGSDGDALPIFEAIQSEWFRQHNHGPPIRETPARPAAAASSDAAAGTPTVGWELAGDSAPDAAPDTARDVAGDAAGATTAADAGATADGPRRSWRSPGDEGWRAAAAVDAPAAGGTTAAGLPKRIPGANLVPGSVDAPQSSDAPQPAVRSAATVRDRLTKFHRGVSEGKAAGATRTGDQPDSPTRDERENLWAR